MDTAHFHRYSVAAAFAVLLLVAPACSRFASKNFSPAVPYSTQSPNANSINAKAREINQRGVQAMLHGNPARAEKLFQEALEEDVSFGPAHNNLGLMYLERHQLYLAAWEFEYAANLMPELVEPIVNQGLAYETAERIDRAVNFYRQAYNQNPHHTIALASLVRSLIKQDADASEIGYLLDELIMHDTRPHWVNWAKELRATRYRDQCEECDEGDQSNAYPPGSFEPASASGEGNRHFYELIEDIPPEMEPLRAPVDEPDSILELDPALPAVPTIEKPLSELLRLSPADLSAKPVRLPKPAATTTESGHWPPPPTSKVQQASHESSNFPTPIASQ